MATILRIDSSPRSSRSLSRDLSQKFFNEWQKLRPDDLIIARDVGKETPPTVTEEWIAAAFAKSEARTEEQKEALVYSDQLVDELIPADIIVFSVPMYNYGLPASLKAWVDQVVRVNRTFSFDLSRGEQPIESIQSGKTAVILSASGEGYYFDGQKNSGDNYLHPHLFKCCELLGVEYQYSLGVEFQEFADDRFEKSKTEAYAAIPGLVQDIMSNLV